jgi:hypothetical protein
MCMMFPVFSLACLTPKRNFHSNRSSCDISSNKRTLSYSIVPRNHVG